MIKRDCKFETFKCLVYDLPCKFMKEWFGVTIEDTRDGMNKTRIYRTANDSVEVSSLIFSEMNFESINFLIKYFAQMI